jgi:hypothetical protein
MNYEYQERGHECECSSCGTKIAENQARYVPNDIQCLGRICVICHDTKRYYWLNSTKLKEEK